MNLSVFPLIPIGDLVDRIARPVEVDPVTLYEQIGVRSHGKGLFYKEPVTGETLGEKRVFWVEPDCFVVNIVFAWEQAIGKTTEADRGKIASHRFPMFRPKEGKVSLDYLTYLFKTEYGKYLLGLASPGGAGRNKTLGQSEFLKIAIPCPPLPEQKRIAEVLSTWDGAIEAASRLVDNTIHLKRGLMQDLLGGPQIVSQQKLRDLCTVRRGASPRPISDPKWFAEAGRGWVRISDVTRAPGQFLRRTAQYLSDAGTEASVTVNPGELIMSICATIGVPKFAEIPVCIHDGFVVFKEVSPKTHLPFLYYVLENATARLASGGQPGTQKNINTTIVGDIDVPDLPLKKQKEIAEILASADEMYRVALARLGSFRKERAALLQQLLTGKRRVSTEKEAA